MGTTSLMDWSAQQREAFGQVGSWLETRSRPYFYLAGYAGTGKTTMARQLASEIDGHVLFGAFTGKAASVMRSRGCTEATTLHRLIYLPKNKCRQHLEKLEAELAREQPDADDARIRELEHLIRIERENLRRPAFSLNQDSPVRGAALVVVDEVSMVGDRMGDDLLSFGAPVLVLGDPAQLPPVGEGGRFTGQKPDFLLTEIHRQASGSPIIELATRVREGWPLEPCERGTSRVVRRGGVSLGELSRHDQIICGRNATRRSINERIRSLLGRKSPLPEPGDRLVCLRNDHELGLLNGATWTARECHLQGDRRVSLVVEGEEGLLECVAETAPFLGGDVGRDRDIQSFDFGYALTCHKSQGSQWGSVAVVDESGTFGADRDRWLYTALTRASERVTVVL